MHSTVYAETALTKLSKSLWLVQQRPGYKKGCSCMEQNPVARPQIALFPVPSYIH